MGYYIDFIFEGGRVSTYQEVVDLFCRAGASVIEDDTLPESVKEKYVYLDYPGIRYGFDVYKRPPEQPKGNWAYVRLSWGIEPMEFLHMMEKIITLAEASGCKVYDGQIEEFITRETIEQTLNSLFKGGVQVAGLLGTVRR